MFQAVASLFPANPTFLVRFVRRFGVRTVVFMLASVVGIIVAFQFFGTLLWLFFNPGTRMLMLVYFGMVACMVVTF